VELWFEWDPVKAEANRAKHGVSFSEAATIFGDPLARTIYDESHSTTEDRYVTIGYAEHGRLLLVVHTDRDNRVRIIMARQASARERDEHERRQKDA